MVNCSYPGCNEVLDYLPFKCRYCGRTFCKKHRLPENHNCSFELQIKPQTQEASNIKYSKNSTKSTKTIQTDSSSKEKTYEQIEKEMRDYIRNQERAAMPPPPSRSGGLFGSRSRGYSPFISRSSKPIGTYFLMGITTIFFLISLFSIVPPFILINLNQLRVNFFLHFLSIFTSIFTTTNWFSWIFTLLILFWSGKVIEMQMGTKFLLSLYFLSGLANVFGILFLQSIGLVIKHPFFMALTSDTALYSTQSGAYYGLMVFLLYKIGLEREMRFYLYFIPIRMKAKYILYFIIGIQLIYGTIGIVLLLLENPNGSYYILSSLPQLAGVLIGRYFWKRFGRQIVNFV